MKWRHEGVLEWNLGVAFGVMEWSHGMESWSGGVMEWSFGVQSWSAVLEWSFEASF